LQINYDNLNIGAPIRDLDLIQKRTSFLVEIDPKWFPFSHLPIMVQIVWSWPGEEKRTRKEKRTGKEKVTLPYYWVPLFLLGPSLPSLGPSFPSLGLPFERGMRDPGKGKMEGVIGRKGGTQGRGRRRGSSGEREGPKEGEDGGGHREEKLGPAGGKERPRRIFLGPGSVT
jgi:hypothetical protein